MGRVWPLWERSLWASEQVPLSIWLFSLVTRWLLTAFQVQASHTSVWVHIIGVVGQGKKRITNTESQAFLQSFSRAGLKPWSLCFYTHCVRHGWLMKTLGVVA